MAPNACGGTRQPERGEDDPFHSRQGGEDLYVMLLALPRVQLRGFDEAGVRQSSR